MKIILFFFLLLPLFVPPIGAVPNQFINIELSSSCQLLNSINSTTCPRYSDLFYLDESIQKYSGILDAESNSRLESPTKSKNLYSIEDKWRVFVDPPKDIAFYGKTISIYPTLPKSPIDLTDRKSFTFKTFLNYTEQTKQQFQEQRFYYENRYVDSSCYNAQISASSSLLLLEDTIHYLKNHCITNSTIFSGVTVENYTNSPYLPSSSPAYQELEYWKEKALTCIFEYGVC